MMLAVIGGIGPEVPFILIFLVLVLMHRTVKPRANIWISASPDKVFEAIDLYDGKREDWGGTTCDVKLAASGNGIFEKTWVTTMSNGSVQKFYANFSIARREPGQHLEIVREGLEGKSTARELLRQTYRLVPENKGTRLFIEYQWGLRMAMAQLTARADLWGGAYRIKGLVERGVPDDRAYYIISVALSVFTGLLSLAAFAWILDPMFAVFTIVALAVHEFGHLLAYWLMGQPWGRVIFLPFLGAMAMPRLPFQSQGQVIFAALMGPGLSVLLCLASLAGGMLWPEHTNAFYWLGFVTVLLNLTNLLPIVPLDGGIALRSIMYWLMGRFARFGLMGAGLMVTLSGFAIGQILLVVIGLVAIAANFKTRPIDSGLTKLSMLQVCISVFGYVALLASYIALITQFNVSMSLTI
jgi:Zn-dependent protease